MMKKKQYMDKMQLNPGLGSSSRSSISAAVADGRYTSEPNLKRAASSAPTNSNASKESWVSSCSKFDTDQRNNRPVFLKQFEKKIFSTKPCPALEDVVWTWISSRQVPRGQLIEANGVSSYYLYLQLNSNGKKSFAVFLLIQ